MKKLNSLLFSFLLLLVCFLPVQSVSAADDVPLKKDDDPNATTYPRTPRAPVRIAVWASVVETELSVNFLYAIGVAQVTIVDQNASVVYQNVVDTNFSSDLLVALDGWDSGIYTLKVAYGSIKLKGTFGL
jgi:hypothetical protein